MIYKLQMKYNKWHINKELGGREQRQKGASCM